MRTIETDAIATEDGKLIIPLPADIKPGQYRVVAVIEEQDKEKKKRTLGDFPVIDIGSWPGDLPLRREEMYGDDGR